MAAIWDDSSARNGRYIEILLHCLDRDDRILASSFGPVAERLYKTVIPELDGPDWVMRAAVLANATALLAVGDAEDFTSYVALVEATSRREVAQIQSTLDTVLGSPPGLPIATALVRTLVRWNQIERLLIDSGVAKRVAHRDATVCFQASHWLLLADVKQNEAAPLIRNAEEMRTLVNEGNVAEWRRQVSAIAANPCGPHATRLAQFADEIDMPAVKMSVDAASKHYRKRLEKAEKEAVANEIRRLVRLSGATQREFAGYIGTSPSRLSTYANGIVTPSAALMLRIKRTAQALAATEGEDLNPIDTRTPTNTTASPESMFDEHESRPFEAAPPSLLEDLG